MASSSSSSSQPKQYDVFISFRGADIRTDFLSHLHKALTGEGIETFVDDNLVRGEDIVTSLLQTIQRSYLSLVIFSENYASSPICLDELVEISNCNKTMGQIVLPIFYKVDPTHVQELTESFGAAIDKHRKEYSSSKVDSWCQVLKEIAELSGLVSQQSKDDSKFIEKIVKLVINKLDTACPLDSSNSELVGIDQRVNRVESLLCLKSVDLRIVGIWGIGGIGKTTIAKEVYDRIRDQFPTKCFVENVREKSENRATDILQSEILSKLLGNENSSNKDAPTLLSPFNKRRLAKEKVLLVLDDVSDLKQVELLIGKQVNYGPCSRIIMTSRDKQVLKNGGAQIYGVEGLYDRESLELFCLHAFKKRNPEKGYEILSIRAAGYAQGLPLALKVLGSNLYGKCIEEWEDELERLQDISDDKIQKILRLSYEGLNENDKELFLDIACFFKGNKRGEVEWILGTGSKIGISRLVDKSLIAISYLEELEMHDLIQQMGKDITCEEKLLGRRSRLWHHEDILYVLTNKKGTEAIEGISLDMCKVSEDVQLSPEAFEGINNIRFLRFYDSEFYKSEFYNRIVPRYCSIINKVHPLEKNGLKIFSSVLRYLQWDGYPSKSLPISCAESLVELHMLNSKLKKLWDGVQDLKNLKLIDLSGSSDLVKIPNLSKAINLEVLKLSGCRSLVKIPSSLNYLSKLTELNLSYCHSLRSLSSCLEGLEVLDLSGCFRIKKLLKILCYERDDRNATQQVTLWRCWSTQSLPGNLCNLRSLVSLKINGCENIRTLPENFGNLKSLTELQAKRSGLEELPESICNLKLLSYLDVSGSGLNGLPDSICNLKRLLRLNVSGLKNLHGLPNKFGNLESLVELFANGSGLKELPESICNLKLLRRLDISGCVNLVQLPENMRNLISLWKLEASGSGIKYLPQLPSLERLDVRNCGALKSASPSFQLVKEQPKINDFRFENCINLGEEESIKMMEHLLERPIPKKESWLSREPRNLLCVPGSEVPQKMKYKNNNPGEFARITQLELEGFSGIKGFYFCVVLDPTLIHRRHSRIHCRIYARLGHQETAFRCESPRELVFKKSRLESKHVILWGHRFHPHSFLPDVDDYVFQFWHSDLPGEKCYDGIIGCGVHPVFSNF